jgi:hypothetical protein
MTLLPVKGAGARYILEWVMTRGWAVLKASIPATSGTKGTE